MKPFDKQKFPGRIKSVTDRYKVIDECLTELSKYAYTSHAFSILRNLQVKEK